MDFNNTPARRTTSVWEYTPVETPDVPDVTIITPYFNAGATFAETLRSVQRQSFQNWEWLVVDDGTDEPGSLAALASAAEQEKRLRIIRLPENRGISAARNRGLAEARGRYICWLDGDDLLEPTFIEKCAWHLFSSPETAFTRGYSVGFGALQYLWTHGFHDRELFLRENCVEPTSLMRAEVARSVGGFDETMRDGMEDWDFWLRAASRGYWGDTITEPLSWYRRRPDHGSRWKNLRSASQRIRVEEAFRRKYPNLWTDGFPSLTSAPRYQSRLTSGPPLRNPLTRSRPRLLLVVPHFEIGGADRFNLDLVRQLTLRFSWEVTILTTRRSNDEWQRSFLEITSDVFMLHRFLPRSAYADFIRYIIESRDPDVVLLSHSEYGYILLPWLKAQYPGLPVVDLVHIVMQDWKDGGFPRYSCRARPFLRQTIAISEDLKSWLVQQGAPSDEVRVVHCCTDTGYWVRDEVAGEKIRKLWQIPADHPVLLFAGRLAAQKQPRMLAEIVERLRNDGVAFCLVVAGDGPDRPWVEEHLAKSADVRYVGPVDQVQMKALMSAADLLLLPSQEEGVALVLYEAMSMGTVVVATDVGGQRELVTPECGVLVPFNDRVAAEFTDAIKELIRNPAVRTRMAAAGRERVVSFFSLDVMGSRMHQILWPLVMAPRLRWQGSDAVLAPEEQADAETQEVFAADEVADLWNQRLRSGDWMVTLVSKSARVLRESPARRWFRWLELRFGHRFGKWILR